MLAPHTLPQKLQGADVLAASVLFGGALPARRAEMAALMRLGVIGRRSILAPVASNTALAMTAPVVVIAGSPQPCGARSSFLTNTVSICGAPLNRGRW